MIKILPRNILRFLVLVFAQVLVFNNIELNGYLNPFVYTLFIILLPFETPGWVLLSLAFLLGISIDVFSETLGMHTAATVAMAFIRPHMLAVMAPREGYEAGSFPRVFYYGLPWFLKYSSVLIVVHHFVLFFVEMFRFQDFFGILLRVILSALFSIFLINLSQYFVFRK